MNICPHCGHEVAQDARLCPNCGVEVNTVWPPVPEGRPPEVAPPPKPDAAQVGSGTATGCGLSAVAYFFLGAIASVTTEMSQMRHPLYPVPLVFRYGTWTINLVPLAIVGGLYFLLRPRFPSFARGLGYCLLVIGVLLLYGLAVCRQ